MAVTVDPAWDSLCSNPHYGFFPLPRDIKYSNCLSMLLHSSVSSDISQRNNSMTEAKDISKTTFPIKRLIVYPSKFFVSTLAV